VSKFEQIIRKSADIQVICEKYKGSYKEAEPKLIEMLELIAKVTKYETVVNEALDAYYKGWETSSASGVE